MPHLFKYLAVSMLAIIMLPVIYSVYFQVKEISIGVEMRAELERKEKTDTVIIHSSKLHWMEEGREIFVNGLFFDVKFLEVIGDSLRITGLYDYEESGLHKELEDIEDSKKETGRHRLTVKLLIQILDDSIFRIDLSPEIKNVTVAYQRISPNLQTVYLSKHAPPPRA